MRSHLHSHVCFGDLCEVVSVGTDVDTGEHHLRIRILVVDAKKSAGIAPVEREEGDVVVVVAEAPGLLRAGEFHRIERRHIGEQRVAPSDQDVGVVTFGNVMGLVDAGCDLPENERCRCGFGRSCTRR